MSDSQQEQGMSASVSSLSPRQINIQMSEGDGFRVFTADGAWFSGDPFKRIHLNFYQDRFPLPKAIQVTLDAQGKPVGSPTNADSSKNVVQREVGIDIVMTMEAATNFHEFLGKNIDAFTKMNPK